MRSVLRGLMLASCVAFSSLSVAGCAKEEAAPAAPAGFGLSAAEGEDGVLAAQTITVTGKNGYAAKLTLTPIWRVQAGTFNVGWYAGLSQTKRFFQLAEETGDPKGKPSWLVQPDQGVREVRVSFDGAPMVSVKPTTTRATFPTPAGAKVIKQVEIDYGDPESPQTIAWK